MDDDAEDPLWRDAEEVYVDWLLSEDEGRVVPFDRLCASHPRLAAALRRLRAQDGAVQLLARETGALSGGLSGRLGHTEQDAANPSTGTSTEVTAARARGPSERMTQRLLEQVRERGDGIGKYHIDREVGRGSMGRVLRVWDGGLKRYVALKMISQPRGAAGSDPDGDAAKRARTRFVEEAQVTAQLDHPNIVPVHELGVTADGRTYFTMKLVRGRDLREVIDAVHRGSGSWTITRALGILLKACDALAYAHAKGVVHRDLKPANIMVGKFGAVYVMDWGLARLVVNHAAAKQLPDGAMTVLVATSRPAEDTTAENDPLRTQVGACVGTPLYMSPEQARGDLADVGPRSDVYGLGAILYHLLAGVPPYHNGGEKLTGQSVMTQIREGPPRSLDKLAPEVPAELRAIVGKAMARAPEERYEGMSELANDLIAFIEGRVVGAWDRHPARSALKWIVRNRAVSVLAALCATLLLVPLLRELRPARSEADRARADAWHAAALALSELKDEELDATGRAAFRALDAALADPAHDPHDLVERVRALKRAHQR